MSDLTSLVDVKAWLNITSGNDDAILQRLISAASGCIQSWIERDLSIQSYTERRDGTGSGVMVFANYPVTSVAAVSIDGISIPASAGASQPGYLFSRTALMLVNGYTFSRGVGNVLLTYTAGFSEIPKDLEQACIELVALRYKERDRIGHVSKSLGGETVTFSQKDFSDAIATTLRNYKKVIPI